MTTNKSIEEHIVAVQQGEVEAYRFIVESFQRPIYVYCYRLLRNAEEAEDAAQEILMKAYTSIQQYKARVSFSAWLYRIAHNYCLNLLKRRQRQARLQWFLRKEDVAEGPERILEITAFSPPLDQALTSLAPDERSLLILHVFDELTYVEIGEIKGKSPDAIKKKIGRLKQKVRKRMAKWEEEETWTDHNQMIDTQI
ncbi:RNA polymerase sigma factor [Paenibacillus terrigena]|uniref:RNA polymerase sigma factor n=1 Tax=Paenibacillus terrigena TaxID=369333 RepID=UPI000367E21A|nr:RNA polymerase sigma factor [Paenibacillus terrigena]